MFKKIYGLDSKQPISVPVSWDLWKLKKNVWTSWKDEEGKDHEIEIYEGTFWDGASVPRILTPIMPTRGLNDSATLFHDILFESRGRKASTFTYTIEGQEVEEALTMKEVNLLFEAILIQAKYPEIRRILACFAVNIATPILWEKYPASIEDKIKCLLLQDPEQRCDEESRDDGEEGKGKKEFRASCST
jgi:hypothetical protein